MSGHAGQTLSEDYVQVKGGGKELYSQCLGGGGKMIKIMASLAHIVPTPECQYGP